MRKNSNKSFLVYFCFMAGILFLHFSAFDALASENAWKPEYDLILKWVNFFIVIVLIVRFTAKPLMDLLKGRNKYKSDELSSLETEKKKISGELGNTIKMINEKKTLFAETEENIIKQAEKIKTEKIREAELESEQILEKAKQEAEKGIKQASEKLRAEVVNEVFDNLPGAKQE